ncbi:hypothetical protein SKAU_G00352400 [Synaphobranchus kaupii]|uniref:Uncharacterized protein n=1 Tax=Synaphobranchus kaupii TaxID=118154 RepID=A0A9Q1II27_SYNKA|nr:hypothetical protein SKAU_G00352400 [Synaphobranchus kaupii]
MTQKDNPPMREIRRMAQAAWETVVRSGERKDEDPKVFAIQGSSNVPLELEGSENPAQRSPAPRASQDHPSRRNNGAKGGKEGRSRSKGGDDGYRRNGQRGYSEQFSHQEKQSGKSRGGQKGIMIGPPPGTPDTGVRKEGESFPSSSPDPDNPRIEDHNPWSPAHILQDHKSFLCTLGDSSAMLYSPRITGGIQANGVAVQEVIVALWSEKSEVRQDLYDIIRQNDANLPFVQKSHRLLSAELPQAPVKSIGLTALYLLVQNLTHRATQVTARKPLGYLIDSSYHDFELTIPIIGELPNSLREFENGEGVYLTHPTNMIAIFPQEPIQSSTVCHVDLGDKVGMVLHTSTMTPNASSSGDAGTLLLEEPYLDFEKSSSSSAGLMC